MTPFEKTGQLYQAILQGHPAKLVEKALTHLKNYTPTLHEEQTYANLLANTYAQVCFQSQELSDALSSLKFYDQLWASSYTLKASEWKNIAKLHEMVYQKTKVFEHLEKGVFAALRSDDAVLSSKLLYELYLRARSEDTFNLTIERLGKFLQDQPENIDLLQVRADIYKEVGLRSKEARYLMIAIENYERILHLDPDHAHAKGHIIAANTFLGLFTDDIDRICENVTLSQTLSEDSTEELFGKGIASLGYSITAADLDELQNAIYFFQQSTSLNRAFDFGWHYLGICFYLLYEATEELRYLNLCTKFFKKSLDLKPRSETFIQLAIATSRFFEIDQQIEWLEEAKCLFEKGLSFEKGATFPPSEWLFEYANLLDHMGEVKEDESFLTMALDQFNRVLILDPTLEDIHHRIAVTLSHLAEITNDPNQFMRAFCHFRLAHKNNVDHDFVLLDWALSLISFAETVEEPFKRQQIMKEAEDKLLRSAKQGNNQAYYQIACFYSLNNQKDLALDWMKKARSFKALPPMQELLEDAWLENLRSCAEFHHFITLLNDPASDF